MLWEVSYVIHAFGVSRLQWRVLVERKRVADAIVAKYPWATAVKRKNRGETLDVDGSSISSIRKALELVRDRE